MFRIPTRNFLLLLVMSAFLLRLGAVFALRNPHQFHGLQAGHDAVEFNAIALHLARGDGYVLKPGNPTSFRAPGFPLFLAALYTISYENYFLVYVAQCLMGAVTCFLVFFLARKLLPERQARTSAALAALYFPAIYLSTVFLGETLFIFCLSLGLFAFVSHLRRPSLLQISAAGVALGCATLTRPFAILLLPAFLAVLAMKEFRERRPRLRLPAIAFAAAFMACVIPWTIRNYTVFHRFVLVATNGGSTFYGGNNDRVLHERSYLGGWISTVYLPGRAEIDATPDEVSHDQREWKLGTQWALSHLGDIPKLLVFKFVRFWSPDISSTNRKFATFDAIAYGPFLILLATGFVGCARNRQCWTLEWLPVHLVLATTIFTALFFSGLPRYRDGILPVLALYAAIPWRARLAERLTPETLLFSNQANAVTRSSGA